MLLIPLLRISLRVAETSIPKRIIRTKRPSTQTTSNLPIYFRKSFQEFL